MIEVLRQYGIDQRMILLRIAQQIDVVVTRMLRPQAGHGFDPVTGRPSVSNLQYTHPPRTAEELRETPEAHRSSREQRGNKRSLPWMR